MSDFEVLVEGYGFTVENALNIIDLNGLVEYKQYAEVAAFHSVLDLAGKKSGELAVIGKEIVDSNNRFLEIGGKIYYVFVEDL